MASFPHGVKGKVTPEDFTPGFRQTKQQTNEQIFNALLLAFSLCGHEVRDHRVKPAT